MITRKLGSTLKSPEEIIGYILLYDYKDYLRVSAPDTLIHRNEILKLVIALEQGENRLFSYLRPMTLILVVIGKPVKSVEIELSWSENNSREIENRIDRIVPDQDLLNQVSVFNLLVLDLLFLKSVKGTSLQHQD